MTEYKESQIGVIEKELKRKMASEVSLSPSDEYCIKYCIEYLACMDLLRYDGYDRDCMTQWNEPNNKHYMVWGSSESIKQTRILLHYALVELPALRREVQRLRKQLEKCAPVCEDFNDEVK